MREKKKRIPRIEKWRGKKDVKRQNKQIVKKRKGNGSEKKKKDRIPWTEK